MQSARIPKRVPVGTKYVVEGKAQGEGRVQIYSRYLIFPDGRMFDLPPDDTRPAGRRAPAH
jgi:predicted component of type VI protein secretion system